MTTPLDSTTGPEADLPGFQSPKSPPPPDPLPPTSSVLPPENDQPSDELPPDQPPEPTSPSSRTSTATSSPASFVDPDTYLRTIGAGVGILGLVAHWRLSPGDNPLW